MDWFARGIRLPLLFAAGALVAFMLPLQDPYTIRLLTLVGIYALLGIGFQFALGLAGILSLAQGAFFGLGAYATALIGVQGWGTALTLPASAVAALTLALVVAGPTLRLASHYLALATLGVAQLLLLAAIGWTEVTGGANGIAGVPGVALLGETLGGRERLAFVWVLVLLAGLALYQVRESLIGRAYAAMTHDPLAATAAGLSLPRLRFAGFLASAGIAGAAGALHAHTLGVVSPEVLDFEVMVRCLTIVLVGGIARSSGAVLGAFVVVLLPEWFQVLEGYRLLLYGAILLAAIVFAPDGVIGALERLRRFAAPEPAPAPPHATQRPAPRAVLATTRPAVALERVTKRYGGVAALDDVSLSIARGELFGLIGPNGSGKTTLINVVSGLAPPEGGRVILSGIDATRASPGRIAALGVARTFQSVHLDPAMTTVDAVAVARVRERRAGMVGAAITIGPDPNLVEARGEATALLAALGVEAYASAPTGTLPPGVQRRVELARALAVNPDLLLLDEPAAGLTEAEQADLAGRLRGLKTRGLAMVVVEHNLGFLFDLVDRVACLDQGRVIAVGTPAQIRNDPDVVAAYLGPAAGRASR